MSRIKFLISLLYLISLIGCSYSFVLDKGTSPTIKLTLDPSSNETSLREGGMVLDSQLEKTFSSMGMLSTDKNIYTLKCSIVSSSHQAITTTSLNNPNDRYRLTIHVTAVLKDNKDKIVWKSGFSDEGTYAQGGQSEDALDKACEAISLQIARTVSSLTL